MVIKTYKIKHEKDFSHELNLAKKVAWAGMYLGTRSSKDVKHIGLKSEISNQILRKYVRNKKIKSVKSVKLTIPGRGVKIKEGKIWIPSVKTFLEIWFDRNFEKINLVELGKKYAYISVEYQDVEPYKPKTIMGVDRNTKGHAVVASNIDTGKVLKLGKSCNHIHNKYKQMKRKFQRKKKLKKAKQVKNREKNIVEDINHKISRKLVNDAKKVKGGIVLENLKSIRKNAKTRRKQRYSLNSWSFYQLGQMIEYKAKELGVPIFYVAPQYTSQRCSDCGHIEKSNRKQSLFECKNCGKVENADANAGFNIAYLYQNGISQFCKERDLQNGSTGTPEEALLVKPQQL